MAGQSFDLTVGYETDFGMVVAECSGFLSHPGPDDETCCEIDAVTLEVKADDGTKRSLEVAVSALHDIAIKVRGKFVSLYDRITERAIEEAVNQ